MKKYSCDKCGLETDDDEECLRWFRVIKYPRLKFFCSPECLRNGVYPD